VSALGTLRIGSASGPIVHDLMPVVLPVRKASGVEILARARSVALLVPYIDKVLVLGAPRFDFKCSCTAMQFPVPISSLAFWH